MALVVWLKWWARGVPTSKHLSNRTEVGRRVQIQSDPLKQTISCKSLSLNAQHFPTVAATPFECAFLQCVQHRRTHLSQPIFMILKVLRVRVKKEIPFRYNVLRCGIVITPTYQRALEVKPKVAGTKWKSKRTCTELRHFA